MKFEFKNTKAAHMGITEADSEKLNEMMTKDFALEHVITCVMSKGNFEKEVKATENATIISDDFLDLKVGYRVCGKINNTNASYMVNDKLLEGWNITADVLRETAKQNTIKATIINPIEEAIGIETMEDSVGTLVITNNGAYHGAGAFIYEDFISELLGKYNTDFYILPSSIHEVLAIPKIKTDEVMSDAENVLREMVREVNTTEVSDKDKLSYSLYFYDNATKKISIKR